MGFFYDNVSVPSSPLSTRTTSPFVSSPIPVWIVGCRPAFEVQHREERIVRFEWMRAKREKKKGYICEFVFAHDGLTQEKEQR